MKGSLGVFLHLNLRDNERLDIEIFKDLYGILFEFCQLSGPSLASSSFLTTSTSRPSEAISPTTVIWALKLRREEARMPEESFRSNTEVENTGPSNTEPFEPLIFI